MNHILKTTLTGFGISLAVLGLAAAQERFDMRVRNDFFAGFAGNQKALDRAMKICEEELARNPGNAAALVWRSGVFLKAERIFKPVTGLRAVNSGGAGWVRWTMPSKWRPMHWAYASRGARCCSPHRALPNAEMAHPLIEGVSDFERALEIQENRHAGRIRAANCRSRLADGCARLGKDEQATAYLSASARLCPAAPCVSAEKWLARRRSPREAGCLGCHVANEGSHDSR
jgi:hypothetical protein